ncbi:MAG: 50S ribosomal protein L20 [Erysipelotrichaceae bacterium]|jgi:large subunit ribosomal protein L20|nr:50S ribosomal protein L20 [Erysipelotrichaceae bacterium]
MRVKNSPVTHQRRKKILKQAKGYFGSKHLLFKTAKEQVQHSLQYAYIDRRLIKRDFRKLWIKRINAACRINEISYSRCIDGLKKNNINVNRKMLSEMAIHDAEGFKKLVDLVKKA